MHVDVTSGLGFLPRSTRTLPVPAERRREIPRTLLRATVTEGIFRRRQNVDASVKSERADFAGTFFYRRTRSSSAAEGGKLWLTIGTQRVALERAGGDRFVVKHPDFDLFAWSLPAIAAWWWKRFTVRAGSETSATPGQRPLIIRKNGTPLQVITETTAPGLAAPYLYAQGKADGRRYAPKPLGDGLSVWVLKRVAGAFGIRPGR